ncbi:MAG: hypothetical protein AUI57_07195 [Candidatus Rokubacteria bacterium 13_1_40CM_2_68_8]|nr:MAG: hypothetical protein AUI57_07195 [Candidatus Rokubacteria bacterium 13_1_40CM_2_68_8]
MTYRPGGRVGRETHLVLLVLCVGCGATSAPPPTGTGDLTVSATTTGSNLDPDGYTVTIDGGASQAIGIAGSVTFAALGAGSHSVQLTGVAANCTVSGSNPQTVSVPAGGTAQVSWAVSCAAEAVLYTQQFTGSDGSDWPAPWAPIGGFIPVHDIQGNRGRFSSATGHIGRMLLGGFSQRDVDARWVFSYEDPGNQGAGIYVRQDGQYVGNGYALFLEGVSAGGPYLGVWRGVNGVETRFAFVQGPVPFTAGTTYHFRFQVVQLTATSTQLRGKVWPDGTAEPIAWTIEATDGTAVLQNVAGTLAFDDVNYAGMSHVFVDSLRVIAP